MSAIPAHATVITCDNLPVMVNCYHWGPNGPVHCDVWIAALDDGCINRPPSS